MVLRISMLSLGDNCGDPSSANFATESANHVEPHLLVQDFVREAIDRELGTRQQSCLLARFLKALPVVPRLCVEDVLGSAGCGTLDLVRLSAPFLLQRRHSSVGFRGRRGRRSEGLLRWPART